MIKIDNFYSPVHALSGIPAILNCILVLGFISSWYWSDSSDEEYSSDNIIS